MYIIYTLHSAQHDDIRYIGLTRNPAIRLTQHLACDGTNPGKDIWIQDVLRKGGRIRMSALEIVETIDKAREREAYWIHHSLQQGKALTNVVHPKTHISKKGQIFIAYTLEKRSAALRDLDAFCEEWGNISRADATQRIIIAWSKSRRGDPGAFGAMGIALSVTSAPASTTETVPSTLIQEVKPVNRRPINGNAKAVELDIL